MISPDTAVRTFRRLHEEGLLLLPNAWDAGSARLIESLGAKAIATTSSEPLTEGAMPYAEINALMPAP